MKKLFATLLVIASALNILAQNTYVLGDYVPYEWSQSGREKVAAVYKNGELLYTAGNGNTIVYPKTILCDSYENVYWMVNSGSTEIWKNDQLFITTADTNKGIGNMFIKNDTLYYAGYETLNGIPVAKIWKGENYTPHLTLGDGIHHSAIRNLSKDETSGNIYYCGYIRNDSINLPAVWNEAGLLYSLPSTTDFEASEICIDSGNIYTLNIGQSYPVYGTVYKNETRLYSSLSEYDTRIYTLCAKDDNWYTYRFRHYGDHAIIMNGNAIALDFGYASFIDHNMPITKMKRIGDDIYATGFIERNEGHTGTIWKNFEVFQTMNSHCTVVGDICFELHNGINEDGPSTGSGTAGTLVVYPNPTNGVLFVETRQGTSLPDQTAYRITNLIGQTLLQGRISAETQHIDISTLPAGLYFISGGKQTVKFVVK